MIFCQILLRKFMEVSLENFYMDIDLFIWNIQ